VERGDYDGIVSLFSKYAVVDSPLYGKMQASEFFKDLLKDTVKAKINIISIFSSVGNTGGAAAHVSCQWILKNSQFANYEGIDIFSISPEGKIDKLKVIHDTAGLRDAWDKASKR
jgi:hypothetical protein